MQTAPERACLLIADISGYTGYLAGVELDHAQDILGDLVGTVVGALRPSFKLAKLEGDAAFAFMPGDEIDGSALQDVVERCYFTFRRRLRDIAQASRCECNACIRIPSLDLKLLAHHGTIARQKMAGMTELVGADVILVHRLLKNTVGEALDLPAYALYTDACMAAMGMGDPATAGFARHAETYDVIGDVVTWVRDLEAAWQAELERKRLRITEDETFWKKVTEYDAPPALVWEYVTSPLRRPQYSTDVTEVIEYSPNGRRGAGTTNHCMHGADAIVEEIVDWRPFEYWTTANVFPVPGSPKILMSDEFEELPGGRTRVVTRVARGTAKTRAFLEGARETFEHAVETATAELAIAVADAAHERAADADLAPAPDVAPEPVVPTPAIPGGSVPVGTAEPG